MRRSIGDGLSANKVSDTCDSADGSFGRALVLWFDNPSEQVAELFLGQTGLADQRPEGAFGEFAVVGHREASHGGMAQNNVAACLVIDFLTHLAKGANDVRAGAHRQLAHAGTSTTSSVTGRGTGSLCFFKLAM